MAQIMQVVKGFSFFRGAGGAWAQSVLLGALLVVSFSAAAASQVLAEPEFKKAVEAYADGRLDESKLGFERLAKRFPDDPNVLNNLAVIAARQGDVERAVDLLRRVIATDAAIDTGYRNLTAVYAHLATLSYREALALESAEPEPLDLSLIGEAERTLRDEIEASEQVAQAKELDEPLVRDPEVPAASARHVDVVSSVKRWAQAWSRQDLNAYFSSYVSGYAPPDGSHRRWKRQRTERLIAPRKIQVSLSDIRVRKSGEDDARVTFRQKYRSNLLSSSVLKRLQMKRINNEWKITSEQVL